MFSLNFEYRHCTTQALIANRPYMVVSSGFTTTDREQRRLAGKGDPKYIFTIPRAILPKPSLCDEITATKSVTKTCNEIIASRSVCSRSVCRGQLTWLGLFLRLRNSYFILILTERHAQYDVP